ncbi:uncharacterized protein LOC126911057 [Spodoptera frugiperda]|uniref:Uncharacterized protein LOC126911057 n=1 Tax=Spodoptera frugiperda TaxID=7108 RepID=A0A9R0DRG5_SPOFR|nr:uncharacterized protein LOC126911057 [Spodoptera frugiperda]
MIVSARAYVYTLAFSFVRKISVTMDVEIAAAVCLCAVSYYNFLSIDHRKKILKPWRRRRWWMVTMHRNRSRSTMENQLAELMVEPSGQFNNFTRMSIIDFEYLLQQIAPFITKKNTPKREAIPAKIRLAITLRFLATGDSFESLHFLFKVSSSIISRIVPEVCIALNQVLKDQIRIPEDPRSGGLKVQSALGNHFIGAPVPAINGHPNTKNFN